MRKINLIALLSSAVLFGFATCHAAPSSKIESSFFTETPLQLGQKADQQGALPNGRYFTHSEGETAKASGIWATGKDLTEKTAYLVTCTINITDAAGNQSSGRVSTRFGKDADLAKTMRILETKVIKGPTEFISYHVHNNALPNFGAVSTDLQPGCRVEVTDVSIEKSYTPWDVVPKKSEKIFYINDVLVGVNSLRSTPIPIPPGATEAHVKVTYAPEKITTTAAVKAHVSHNGQKGFDAKSHVIPPSEIFTWRDGDDRDHWLTFEIKNPSSRPGDCFRGAVKGAGVGGWFAFDFIVQEGAVNKRPKELPFHRTPYQLVLPETPTKDLDMTSVEWDESGFKDGKPVWATHPAYIYTQPGNSETGVYLPCTKGEMNAPGINPHSLETDAEGRPYVKLHTRKLPEPVVFDKNKSFPHQASMLQAQELDEWCYRRGIYSVQLVLPDRRGAWSAFWACGRHYPTKNPMWPPEVDFLESFNGAYGDDYRPDTTSAGQHAGVHGSVSRAHIDGFEFDVIELGFSPELNFNTQIHDYTTVIEDEWITHFRDGIEFFRHRNILDAVDGEDRWDFYPIINVAVKDASGGEYNTGSGDMRWYGLQYYAPDSGYSMQPYTHEKPYPNGEILPRPKM